MGHFIRLAFLMEGLEGSSISLHGIWEDGRVLRRCGAFSNQSLNISSGGIRDVGFEKILGAG